MTTSGKFLLEPAWILHHYPYRDSSLLLEVFSREHGRLGLVARGARSSKSRWRGLLHALSQLLLSWSMRGEMGTLTGAETRPGIVMPGTRNLMSAWYLNELLMRLLTRHDPHPRLFSAYEQALQGLEVTEQPTLRIFEKQLLQELGYELTQAERQRILDNRPASLAALDPKAAEHDAGRTAVVSIEDAVVRFERAVRLGESTGHPALDVYRQHLATARADLTEDGD